MSEKNQGFQNKGRGFVEIDTLLLGIDENNIIVDKVLS